MTTPLPKPATVPEAPLYSRLIVVIVITCVALVAFTAAFLSASLEADRAPSPVREIFVGSWSLLVSDERPPAELLIIAVLGMAIIAVVALSLEAITTVMTISPRRRYLEALRGDRSVDIRPGEQVRITVLVPAHNEEQALPITLGALAAQTRKPDRVIVVADNCTDRTPQIAREMGYEAFETVDNQHKKGGALNQVLTALLPTAGPRDVVLVMDADTSLGPEFIEAAAGRLEADPELAAVGGLFYGEDGGGILGQFQRNEYTRYSMQIRQRRGRVFVLTGTATMFRA
ncbi:MAG: glycosyltransferase family 2 protein, partial [Candidatus Nanopelagicales bacterium]